MQVEELVEELWAPTVLNLHYIKGPLDRSPERLHMNSASSQGRLNSMRM